MIIYEVEKRSLLTEEEFNRCKDYLDKHAKFLGVGEFKSFLFRKPSYLRIRLVKGKDDAIITIKLGEYTDPAREENEVKISLKDLPRFIKEKSKLGFNECACVSTKSYPYKLNELRADLNKIEILGNIIEIEALTKNKEEIPKLNEKINEILKLLNLKELDSMIYQKMMNNMYSKTLKSISKQSFKIE